MSGARRSRAFALLACLGWLASPAGAAPQGDEAIRRLRSEARQLEQDGQLAGALQKYALLSEQFPESPAAAEALLRMTIGYRELGRDDESEEAAGTLIRTQPRSRHAAGAYTFLGRLQAEHAEDEPDLDEARITLENADLLFPRASYPVQPWRAEAVVLGARVALRLGRDAEAARRLTEVIDFEPRSRWAAEARFELASLLLGQGDWPAAAGLLQEIVDWAGDGDEERALAAQASRRLALVQRLGLRPDAAQERWQRGRLVGAAPERPVAVAAADDGRLAVTDSKNSTVVLGPDEQVVSRWSHQEAQRNSWRGGELIVVTSEAASTFPERHDLQFASPPGEKRPTIRALVAVEAAPFGRWLVLADKPPRAVLYEPERRLHQTLVGGKGSEPVDLAADPRGRLLVLDQRARSVSRFAAGAERGERLISGNWNRAAAMAVDAMGNIYVLDREDGRIEMFDRAGKKLTALGPMLPGGLELRRPADLTVDGAGRLWIADPRLGLVVLE